MHAAVTAKSSAGRPSSRQRVRSSVKNWGGAGADVTMGGWSLTRRGGPRERESGSEPEEVERASGDYDCAGVAGVCDRFWRSLPGLKRIVRPGGIFTSLPVRGLRPIPRLRGFTWKTPKPRSSILSPFIMESFIASSTASTATSALTFVMSAAFETSLMMSTLIMGMDLLLSDDYYRLSRKNLSTRTLA